MSDAEMLVDLAKAFAHPRMLVIDGSGLPPSTADTVVLALRLRNRPDVVLRAIMEDWTRFQIVRELY